MTLIERMAQKTNRDKTSFVRVLAGEHLCLVNLYLDSTHDQGPVTRKYLRKFKSASRLKFPGKCTNGLKKELALEVHLSALDLDLTFGLFKCNS